MAAAVPLRKHGRCREASGDQDSCEMNSLHHDDTPAICPIGMMRTFW
jgi:hypothetical protein